MNNFTFYNGFWYKLIIHKDGFPVWKISENEEDTLHAWMFNATYHSLDMCYEKIAKDEDFQFYLKEKEEGTMKTIADFMARILIPDQKYLKELSGLKNPAIITENDNGTFRYTIPYKEEETFKLDHKIMVGDGIRSFSIDNGYPEVGDIWGGYLNDELWIEAHCSNMGKFTTHFNIIEVHKKGIDFIPEKVIFRKLSSVCGEYAKIIN